MKMIKDSTKKAEEHLLTQEFEYEKRMVYVLDIHKLFATNFIKYD